MNRTPTDEEDAATGSSRASGHADISSDTGPGADMGTAGGPADPAAVDPSAPTERSRRRFSLAWRRQPWWLEVLIIGLGYLLYEFIQGTAPVKKDDAAFTNSADVDHWESLLHVNIELSINHFVNARPTLASLTGYYYDSMHYVITPLVLLWLWRWRPDTYARWRSALVVASMSALVVFWLYPVAPPRLALPGITDTLVVQHILGTVSKSGSDGLVNQYAAMPSLHVGWALWCAVAIVGNARSRWRQLAWLYPAATTFVVIGTGNHYLLDGVGGLVVVSLGLALTATSSGRTWTEKLRLRRRAG